MPTTARLAWCTAKRRTLPQGANVPYRCEVGRRGADPPTCRTGKYGRRTHSLPTRQSTANIRSEIVRAKDKVSVFSGARPRGAVAGPGLIMRIEVDVACRLQDGVCA